MKRKERDQAIQMRKRGAAMGEIARELGVAKSSVSLWVRDIALTTSQRNKLNTNGYCIEAIEKRRIARLENTRKRREEIVARAKLDAKKLSKKPLWCVAVALYWGEGGKTQNMARIANSDPDVIRLMMRFFREVCSIPEEKFRGHIHTFAHCDAKRAERYWSSVSSIPTNQFFKTYKKQSSASKDKRDTLPYGTFQIYIHDTDFFFRLMGWIEYLKENKL